MASHHRRCCGEKCVIDFADHQSEICQAIYEDKSYVTTALAGGVPSHRGKAYARDKLLEYDESNNYIRWIRSPTELQSFNQVAGWLHS